MFTEILRQISSPLAHKSNMWFIKNIFLFNPPQKQQMYLLLVLYLSLPWKMVTFWPKTDPQFAYVFTLTVKPEFFWHYQTWPMQETYFNWSNGATQTLNSSTQHKLWIKSTRKTGLYVPMYSHLAFGSTLMPNYSTIQSVFYFESSWLRLFMNFCERSLIN